MIELIITATIYILLNIYVTKKISRSHYLHEEGRRIHKRLIWIVPFIGPLLIRGFWKTEKNDKIETVTKGEREKKKTEFYESGIGKYGDQQKFTRSSNVVAP